MPFDPHHNLTLARVVITNVPEGADPEAVYRCAVGRSYYSAFNHALEYAVQHHGYAPHRSGKDHEDVPSHLAGRPGVGKEVPQKLYQLLGWRHTADYDLNPPNT